ncbi:hypothetical protein V6N13_024523 [Hibiscus sabdariffa]
MLVENRRRRVQPKYRSIVGNLKGKGLVAGSHYKVLEDVVAVEDAPTSTIRGVEPTIVTAKPPTIMSVNQKTVVAQRAVPKNATYLESNPPKKSSKKGVLTSGAVVNSFDSRA